MVVTDDGAAAVAAEREAPGIFLAPDAIVPFAAEVVVKHLGALVDALIISRTAVRAGVDLNIVVVVYEWRGGMSLYRKKSCFRSLRKRNGSEI